MSKVSTCAKCNKNPVIDEKSNGWAFECDCHIWILAANRPKDEAIEQYNELQKQLSERKKAK